MKPVSIVVGLSLALALGCLALAVVAGAGHRMQFWGYSAGFRLLTGAVVGAGIGVVLALIGGFLAWRNGPQTALYGSIAALVLGLITVLPPLSWARTARQLPYIHDITTDMENPPAFVAMLPQRANAPNTAEYTGPETAKLQRAAYPDIKPLHLRVPPAEAFNAALETARSLGWRIIDRNSEAGRIEASDQTFWFGFVDDVVIRVTSLPDGARVDARSVSRVGASDIGTNAKRIRRFQKELSERVRSSDAR